MAVLSAIIAVKLNCERIYDHMANTTTPPNIYRIGLIGHRNITDPAVVAQLKDAARQLFAAWQTQYAALAAYSPLAIGADTILAEVALEFGANLTAVVPFKEYEDDFSEEERERYHNHLYKANNIEILPFDERSSGAYLTVGIWIVDHVDVIIAAWDGLPARGTGGTADIVEYAQERQKELHIIPTPR